MIVIWSRMLLTKRLSKLLANRFYLPLNLLERNTANQNQTLKLLKLHCLKILMFQTGDLGYKILKGELLQLKMIITAHLLGKIKQVLWKNFILVARHSNLISSKFYLSMEMRTLIFSMSFLVLLILMIGLAILAKTMSKGWKKKPNNKLMMMIILL